MNNNSSVPKTLNKLLSKLHFTTFDLIMLKLAQIKTSNLGSTSTGYHQELNEIIRREPWINEFYYFLEHKEDAEGVDYNKYLRFVMLTKMLKKGSVWEPKSKQHLRLNSDQIGFIFSYIVQRFFSANAYDKIDVLTNNKLCSIGTGTPVTSEMLDNLEHAIVEDKIWKMALVPKYTEFLKHISPSLAVRFFVN